LAIAAEIGRFPLIIRPAFTLGGTGGGISYNLEEFKDQVKAGIDASMTDQVGVFGGEGVGRWGGGEVGREGRGEGRIHMWGLIHKAGIDTSMTDQVRVWVCVDTGNTARGCQWVTSKQWELDSSGVVEGVNDPVGGRGVWRGRGRCGTREGAVCARGGGCRAWPTT
jgi:hypothetical protein